MSKHCANRLPRKHRRIWLTLPGSCLIGACAVAPAQTALTDVAVIATQQLSAADYADATAVADTGANPLMIALAIAGPFDGAAQHLVQTNSTGEQPRLTKVSVLRDGLLDDSVRSMRYDIELARVASGGYWSIKRVSRAWRCWRGPQRDTFGSRLCR